MVVALLRLRGSGRLLVAVSTHFYYNPEFPQLKATQAAMLAWHVRKHLAAWKQDPVATPVVVGGDLNACPWVSGPSQFDPECPEGGMRSGVYSLLVEGVLRLDHPDHPLRRQYARMKAPASSQYGVSEAGLGQTDGACAASDEEDSRQEPLFPPLTSSGLTFRSAYQVQRPRLDLALTSKQLVM